MNIPRSELLNRRDTLLDRVAAQKAALDRGDLDGAYALAGDIASLAGLLVDAAERVVAQEAHDAAA